jgi:hypothetical protein
MPCIARNIHSCSVDACSVDRSGRCFFFQRSRCRRGSATSRYNRSVNSSSPRMAAPPGPRVSVYQDASTLQEGRSVRYSMATSARARVPRLVRALVAKLDDGSANCVAEHSFAQAMRGRRPNAGPAVGDVGSEQHNCLPNRACTTPRGDLPAGERRQSGFSRTVLLRQGQGTGHGGCPGDSRRGLMWIASARRPAPAAAPASLLEDRRRTERC